MLYQHVLACAVAVLAVLVAHSEITRAQLTEDQKEAVLTAHNRYRSEAVATNMLKMVSGHVSSVLALAIAALHYYELACIIILTTAGLQ